MTHKEIAENESVNQLAERLYWEFDDKRSKKKTTERMCFKNTIMPHLHEATKDMFTRKDMEEAFVAGRSKRSWYNFITGYRKEKK